jgi:hypothetical protein
VNIIPARPAGVCLHGRLSSNVRPHKTTDRALRALPGQASFKPDRRGLAQRRGHSLRTQLGDSSRADWFGMLRKPGRPLEREDEVLPEASSSRPRRSAASAPDAAWMAGGNDQDESSRIAPLPYELAADARQSVLGVQEQSSKDKEAWRSWHAPPNECGLTPRSSADPLRQPS